MIQRMLAIWSLVPLPFLNPAWTSWSSRFMYCWSLTWRILTQTCPWVSRSLWWKRGTAVACCRVGDTEYSTACMGPFERGCHFLHYLHHSLASGQITGRKHSPTLQPNIGLKIYCGWPPHQNKTQFRTRPSVSLFHQEASISLLSFSIKGQTDWIPQSQKTNQSDHVDHSLV